MMIKINGQLTKLTNFCSLQDILSTCQEYQKDSIVIINNKYVKNNEDYKDITIHDGDEIDIINFLAGG